MGLIIIFGVLIIIYKHIDMKCLYRIGIKYFYDEWGYYLTYICRDKCRDKFVGTSQVLESSKFHKFSLHRPIERPSTARSRFCI